MAATDEGTVPRFLSCMESIARSRWSSSNVLTPRSESIAAGETIRKKNFIMIEETYVKIKSLAIKRNNKGNNLDAAAHTW